MPDCQNWQRSSGPTAAFAIARSMRGIVDRTASLAGETLSRPNCFVKPFVRFCTISLTRENNSFTILVRQRSHKDWPDPTNRFPTWRAAWKQDWSRPCRSAQPSSKLRLRTQAKLFYRTIPGFYNFRKSASGRIYVPYIARHNLLFFIILLF